MRKRIALMLGLLSVTLLIIFWSASEPWHPRINRGSAERIKRGMTMEEVQELIGCKPGDYRVSPPPNASWPERWLVGEPSDVPAATCSFISGTWMGDELWITVDYHHDVHHPHAHTVTAVKINEPVIEPDADSFQSKLKVKWQALLRRLGL